MQHFGGKFGLWVHAPHLRLRARKQARALRDAIRGDWRSAQGFCPVPGAWYPDAYVWGRSLLGSAVRRAHQAWCVGYHAGRLFALREAAYDARELDRFERLDYSARAVGARAGRSFAAREYPALKIRGFLSV